MSPFPEQQVPAGIDWPRLTSWWQSALPGLSPLGNVWLLSGGRSNLTFGLTDSSGHNWCLRRPPLGHAPPTAHDVAREYRIISALQGSAVPVPPSVAVCSDESVIGAPFYVMGFVGGNVAGTEGAAELLPGEVRAGTGRAAITALLAIHGFEVAGTSLETLARPDSYLARQLRRWRRQLGPESGEIDPRLVTIADQLEARIPPQQRDTLVHGDFKIGNLVLGPGGSVEAVLDWELSTLGDPLADLGWLLASWSQPGDTAVRIARPPTLAEGFDSREQLTGFYAAGSSLDLKATEYYIAFAEWKWACIDVGVHARFSRGQMGTATIDLDTVAGEIADRLTNASELLGS
jgi:aminoglycoside phosphotransferase (APT) family kinase protein